MIPTQKPHTEGSAPGLTQARSPYSLITSLSYKDHAPGLTLPRKTTTETSPPPPQGEQENARYAPDPTT